MPRFREFFKHVQVNGSIDHLWTLLFVNVVLSLVPFIVAAPVAVTLAFGFVAGLSILFHLLKLRIYTPIAFSLAVLMTLSLKSVLPGGTFGGEFYSVLFSAVTLFKTFNLRKYGDGVLLLLLTLGTNSTVLLMSQDSSELVSVWSFAVTVWTIVNLLRLNLRDLSSLALVASVRSALVGVLYTLPLLIFLFYFFQKFSHMGLYARGGNHLSGVSPIMEPGNVESLTKNSAIAFRVVMDRREFPFVSLYWKGPTLSRSKGMKWERGKESGLESRPQMNFVSNDSCLVAQTVFLQSVDLASYRIALNSAIPSLFSYLPGNAYRATSKICNEMPFVKGSAEAEKRYLEVETEISPEVKTLAHQLSIGTTSPMEFASHLYKYYRLNKFKYSLTPPTLSPLHQLDDFLFNKRVGFCEHFAASFATLARLAGYPSRVVTGFQGGKYNRFGNYWVVSFQDAHAWVELWDKSKGWITIDPTEIVAPERLEKGSQSWTSQIRPWWEELQDNSVWQAGDAFFFWLRALFDQRETLISLDDLTPSNVQLLGFALVAGLLLLIRRLRRNYEKAVDAQFKKLCLLLDQKTIPRGRTEGFENYRTRLLAWVQGKPSLHSLASRLDLIFTKMIQLKYGSSTSSRGELRVLYYDLRAAQRDLRIKSNLLVRLFENVG